MKKNTSKNVKNILAIILFIIIGILGISTEGTGFLNEAINEEIINTSYNLEEIPEYSGNPYVTINDNIPNFDERYFNSECFEKYSGLDSLGRCGVAFANLGKQTMPKENESRTSISHIKPTGWQSVEYDGKSLYNRCHLIAYSLSAENANNKNLITGTNYFNVSGMLPFETKVLDYLRKNEKNHVLYRVTPIFEGKNLVVNGVQIEAKSIEDDGICFNVYIYNVQPGIKIDYATGNNKLEN